MYSAMQGKSSSQDTRNVQKPTAEKQGTGNSFRGQKDVIIRKNSSKKSLDVRPGSQRGSVSKEDTKKRSIKETENKKNSQVTSPPADSQASKERAQQNFPSHVMATGSTSAGMQDMQNFSVGSGGTPNM